MPWPFAYWDAIEELYWEPSLLGLGSIPKSELAITENHISIPRAHISKGASIYTRSGSSAENLDRLRRLEVPLNHLFQITFAIAPNSAIRTLLHSPLGICLTGKREQIHTMEQASIGKRLAKFISGNREHFVDAARRLQLAQISWRSLATQASAMAEDQDATNAGGETVRRLLLGLVEGIHSHRGACDG